MSTDPAKTLGTELSRITQKFSDRIATVEKTLEQIDTTATEIITLINEEWKNGVPPEFGEKEKNIDICMYKLSDYIGLAQKGVLDEEHRRALTKMEVNTSKQENERTQTQTIILPSQTPQPAIKETFWGFLKNRDQINFQKEIIRTPTTTRATASTPTQDILDYGRHQQSLYNLYIAWKTRAKARIKITGNLEGYNFYHRKFIEFVGKTISIVRAFTRLRVEQKTDSLEQYLRDALSSISTAYGMMLWQYPMMARTVTPTSQINPPSSKARAARQSSELG